MYGIGYGLGKMVEGATTGMLAQKKYEDAKAIRAAEKADEKAYKTRQLDIQEREGAAKGDLAKITRSTSALRIGLEALEKTGDKEFANKMYGLLDPEGAQGVDFNVAAGNITIDTPEYTFTGPKGAVQQANAAMNANPHRAGEIIQKAAELGVIKITKKPPREEKEKYFTLAPGQMVVDRQGKVIAQAPERESKPSATDKQASVTNYGTFITKVFSKYKMGDAGFTVDADGNMKVDVAKLFGSQQSAYDVLKEKAKTAPEAKQDLADLQEAYGKIRGLLGIGQPAAVPADPGTLGGMVSGPAGPAAGVQPQLGALVGKTGAAQETAAIPGATAAEKQTGAKKKAVFDSKTGRFIYR